MRIVHGILFAALMAAPAMADEVVITTPGSGGDAQHDLNKAARAEQKADRAAEQGNFGTAAKQEQKADRALRDANRDANDGGVKLKIDR
jgi:opacity protein-like surface antigen